MRTNYVLIDFESVQPNSFATLSGDDIKILVFVGAKQDKLPFHLAASLQPFGARAKYIKISASGRNALDFHIAYYIGRLAIEDPSASFQVISKDTGFDPLIEHLKFKKIVASRVETVGEIRRAKPANSKSTAKGSNSNAAAKASNGKPLPERVRAIINRLQKPKVSKPAKVKKLKNMIASVFQKSLSEKEVESLVQSLISRGYVKITGTKVSYALPGDA